MSDALTPERALELVDEHANALPRSSLRTALRMVVRIARTGDRISRKTAPAVQSITQSVTVARGILAMALEGGNIAAAAYEAHRLLSTALEVLETRVEPTDRAAGDDEPE